MQFTSRYVSYQSDAQGFVNYTPEDDRVWQILYERQSALLPNRACDEFIHGLKRLELSAKAVPQLPLVSEKLKALTGWVVSPVAALISAREFFQLLANKQFPAATFIRHAKELDYIQEPDIFHELFGHCPMLTDPIYAEFIHQYGKRVLEFPESEWPLLQRLFWFTVEFGLIKTSKGLRAYGGGILSSMSETAYSVESEIPLRVLFDPIAAFRMPYRIDCLQSTYFVIESYEVLYKFIHQDLSALMQRAKELGEFPPLFPVDENNPSIHIHAC